MEAADVIRLLELQPHPEGGHYREIFRSQSEPGTRGALTSIYFLLAADERSHWHRVDVDEIFHWYAGAPLTLSISEDGQTTRELTLGNDLAAGQRPQGIVPPGAWQAAWSHGAWTLVGCTVAPAFEFSGFEMAPPDWAPGKELQK